MLLSLNIDFFTWAYGNSEKVKPNCEVWDMSLADWFLARIILFIRFYIILFSRNKSCTPVPTRQYLLDVLFFELIAQVLLSRSVILILSVKFRVFPRSCRLFSLVIFLISNFGFVLFNDCSRALVNWSNFFWISSIFSFRVETVGDPIRLCFGSSVASRHWGFRDDFYSCYGGDSPMLYISLIAFLFL